MTANINFTKSASFLKVTQLLGMVETVDYNISLMKVSYNQLMSIADSNEALTIRKQGFDYLAKQRKLLTISRSLRNKMIRYTSELSNTSINTQEQTIRQFNQEVDILVEMHFQLKKTYFSFIQQHTQTQRPVRLMVA